MKAFIQHSDSNMGKMVLQALVPFKELKDSVVFTNKSNPNDDTRAKSDISQSSYNYYQRRIDLSRISKIEDFIIDSILDEKDSIILATLFPSSMILAINDEEEALECNEVHLIDNNEGLCEVKFHSNVFIVDGQHRMLAMRRVFERLRNDYSNYGDLSPEDRQYVLSYIQNYKFNCVILVNYDLWEQGQVFINVNFKQKPVNKSLYYEIFGSKYSENRTDWKRNSIYLAHCMARTLNEHDESPYKGKVKMLGTGKGFISQAFVVESLLKNFRKGGLWDYDVDSIEMKDEDFNFFSTEILSYCYAIRELFIDYWPTDDKPTLISKSTAFGAFVRLMEYVRTPNTPHLKRALQNSALFGEVCIDYVDQAKAVLTPLAKYGNKLFGKESEFKSSSGKGAETKLYKKMKQILDNDYKYDSTLPEIIAPEDISMQLQEFFWTHPIDELDSLAHSNEIEEINNFVVTKYTHDEGTYSIQCYFDLSVIFYIDNYDTKGFTMDFPSSCTATLKEANGALILEDDSVNINVDTSKFFA